MRGYPELKQILELWEQGKSKKNISIITGIPRASVTDCIKRYGTLAQLDAVMRDEVTHLPDFSDTSQKRVYVRPSSVPRPRKYTLEELVEAVAVSYSMAEVMRKLNIRAAGGNYATLKQRIIELGLDTSHFTGKLWSKGKQSGHANRHPLDEILVKDSTYSTTSSTRAFSSIAACRAGWIHGWTTKFRWKLTTSTATGAITGWKTCACSAPTAMRSPPPIAARIRGRWRLMVHS